ncbi:ammonium transporter [Brevibacterium litoralis]|uniref:ammonium transporter n=1 Tax=Brevibacterium litoralis TaxID=3138935 RepID=UPI0032EC152B
MEEALAAADLAWLLSAMALVLLMFPGLALFYGGMASGRNILNIAMMVMGSMAVGGLAYILVGHSLVVGNSWGGLGLIGNPLEYLGGNQFLTDDGANGTYWAGFYLLFATISIAILASGAMGRMKFGSWLVFAVVWMLLVYSPMAHWVFTFSDPEAGYVGGWLRNVMGLHDFAGGTAVHMNAGVSSLALALVLGPRLKTDEKPHNLPLAFLGAGILFFGWFGFNGGTAATAGFLAEFVFLTTLLAGLGGILGFLVVERLRDKRVTALGMCTGMIAGLVGITPVADAVNPVGAVAVGFLASAAVAWAITWKNKHKIDDSLDAFAVHGIGGIAGSLYVILLGVESAPAGVSGVLLGGDWSLVWREIVAILVSVAYPFVVTYLIAKVMDMIHPIRVDPRIEKLGLDRSLHAETAYTRDEDYEEPADPSTATHVDPEKITT